MSVDVPQGSYVHDGRPSPPEAPNERWRCCWTDGRERCHYPGSMSPDTRGTDRWMCRFHFFCGDGATGQQIIEESRSYRRGDPMPSAERDTPAIVAPAPTALPVGARLPYLETELAQEEPGSGG